MTPDHQTNDRRPAAPLPPCTDHERRIALLEQSVDSLKRTNEGVSTKLDLILAQVTKVAILEEKHNTQVLDITRAHDKVSRVEEKHDALAIEIRAFMNQMKGQSKILWSLGAVVGMLLIKVLFFAAGQGMTP
jgi:hypothetical protein